MKKVFINKFSIILSCLLCFLQVKLVLAYENSDKLPLKIKNNIEGNHLITDGQSKALITLSQTKKNIMPTTSLQKNIQINISQLKDSQGNVYLGAIVSKAELSLYLVQLEQHLSDEFTGYREQQAKRDHQQFHLTLINPIEYKTIDKALINKVLKAHLFSNNQATLNVTLLGLGNVNKDNKSTYFVVAQSDNGQLIRQQLLLKRKDFHVTLGFKPSDIYGVSKGIETLIKPTSTLNQ